MADELTSANNSLAPAQDVDAPSAADADGPTTDSQNEQIAAIMAFPHDDDDLPPLPRSESRLSWHATSEEAAHTGPPELRSPPPDPDAGWSPSTSLVLNMSEFVNWDADTAMADDAQDSAQKDNTPAPASDNPLDAPEGPRPDTEDADAADDEEMGGMDDTKKEGGSPEKDAGDNADAAADDQPTQTKSALENQARSHLIAQTHAIILPSYSTWFDMNTIHNIERKALPEFFNSRNRSKTPAVYKDYRDFMVNTYRLNPAEYLTVTACRRNLAGDVCAIMRVHAFLEQWGLINYQVDPDTRPSNIGPPFTGHFKITADTPRGLQPHQPAPKPAVTVGKPLTATDRLASQTPASKEDLNLEIRRNAYESNGKEVTPADTKEKPANGEGSTANGTPLADSKSLVDALKEPGRQVNCFSCGIDCTRVHYHNTKSAPHSASGKTAAMLKYDLCPNCFLEGRFPSSSAASDYTKIENDKYSGIPDRNAPWTDGETLRLLEALEMFDEDWNQVAEYVGNRTREECVLKFLQLEIEDQYLEEQENASKTELTGGNLSYLSNGRLPFTQADNAVLSVMGFLAGLADPAVTAAAAGKSVDEMKRALREKLEKGGAPSAESDKGKEKEASAGPAADAQVKNEDSMDVDASSPQAIDTVAAQADVSKAANPYATVPLALSAARSAALASHEERNISRLVSSAVNVELQKMQLKLQQFSELEQVLSAERRDLERRRQQLFLDRLGFQKRMRSVEDAFKRATISGPQEGLKIVQEAVHGADAFGEKLGVQKVDSDEEREITPLKEGDEGFKSHEI
ncbi:rsc complex subunit [Diplodia corticola]|uniref:Rsc complex subunit n=1 Tax=Diplodia corticola TaxID=236234 RepID=A0A1J9RN32_9PEZI|nr:rsc complex subunit [Diplodia corticola]OJD29332.1 rsc complex subunit [Diplodia corticola]